MHPAMMGWWMGRRRIHEGACGAEAYAGCGPMSHDHGGHRGFHHAAGHDDAGGGAFGVRRPLRFLAWKLELEEQQVSELAKVLDELKTERAQAAVDQRRSTSALADSVAGGTFDAEKANEGGTIRVESAKRLEKAVVTALSKIHAVLDAEQRERLGYLIRTGQIVI